MSARGPMTHYRSRIARGQLTTDPAQERLLATLQTVHDELCARPSGLLARWKKRWPEVAGAYIVGDVGRGKTMLMDLFAESLADTRIPVWRIHFHRFMDTVHTRLGQRKNERDPLRAIGAEVAARARVVCFDEFHVSDIGDAMILGTLLEAIFDRGVTLVATSNTAPADLYADGLQRERFVPAIRAIEKHCRVLRLDGAEDYRLRELTRHPVYHHPADDRADRELEEEFNALAAGETVRQAPIRIRGHELTPRRRAGSVVWFDFATLCEGPRASADYIELARRFGTLIVSNVPQMSNADNDAARRFIHLVDECYDRAVKLLVSAETAPDALYTGKRLAGPFERTASRLVEMQSHEYLALPHRP